MYICIYVYIYVITHTHTSVYIHTHTHIHTGAAGNRSQSEPSERQTDRKMNRDVAERATCVFPHCYHIISKKRRRTPMHKPTRNILLSNIKQNTKIITNLLLSKIKQNTKNIMKKYKKPQEPPSCFLTVI